MYKKISFIIVLLFLVMFTYPLFAQFLDQEPKAILPSMRMKGMGGVAVGCASDDDSCFWNPAGYSYIKDGDSNWYVNILEFGIRFSAGDISLLKDGVNMGKDFNKSDGKSTINKGLDNVDTLNKLLNSRMNLGINGPLNTGVVWHLPFFDGRIGIGVKLFSVEDMLTKQRDDGLLYKTDLLGIGTAGFIVGGSYSFNDGKAALGLNIKYLERIRFAANNMGVTDTATLIKGDYLKYNNIYAGSAIGFDIGGMYEAFKNFNIGMSVLDIGGTNFHYKAYNDVVDALKGAASFTSGNDMTRAIPPSLNVGVGYKIPELPSVASWLIGNTILGFDIQDMATTRTNVFTRLHFGAETSILPNFLRKWIGFPAKVRVGLNQGYTTVGLGLVFMKTMYLEFAYWRDELGYEPGQMKQDNIGLTTKFML